MAGSGVGLDIPMLGGEEGHNEMSVSVHYSKYAEKLRRDLKRYKVLAAILGVAVCGLVVAVVLVSVLDNSSHPRTIPSSWPRFVHISDLHVDTFYDPSKSCEAFCRSVPSTATTGPCGPIQDVDATYSAPIGRGGCDSPLRLLEETTKAIADVHKENALDFLLVTGDFVGHGLDGMIVDGSTDPTGMRVIDAIADGVSTIRKALPNVAVYPVLGNNDVPVDYVWPLGNFGTVWLDDVFNVWEPMIYAGKNKPQMESSALRQQFAVGGYYCLDIMDNIVLCTLNTLLVSNRLPNVSQEQLDMADQMLEWLDSELRKATQAKKRVLIAGHIPPGVEPFKEKLLWRPSFVTRYTKIVSTHRDILVAQMFGHFHEDDFKVMYDISQGSSDEVMAATSSAMFMTPGLSPIFNDNPSFRLAYINKDEGVLGDYRQYVFDLLQANVYDGQHTKLHWYEEYSFHETYAEEDEGFVIDGPALIKLNQKLIDYNDQHTYFDYRTQHNQRYEDNDRYQFYCAMRSHTTDDLAACLDKYPFHPITSQPKVKRVIREFDL